MARKDILLNGIVVGSHEVTGDNEKDIVTVQNFLKERGLYKEVTTNDAMFGQANSFAEISVDIYNQHLRKTPFKGGSVAPFIVNAVFSVELYLKTIHDAYGNKEKGHHLVSLYKNMPGQGQSHFIEAASDVRPLYQLESDSDIFTCLEMLNKAFEHWRYLYEHARLGAEIQAIRYTMHVSYEACCRVRESVEKT